MAATIQLKVVDKTESEALRAEEAWAMFRACLVQPLRAGRQRKFSARKHWERLLTEWKAGNRQEVWDQAVEIERQRHFKRRGRKPAKKPVRQTKEEQAYRRVKNLVSMDELSKAISAH